MPAALTVDEYLRTPYEWEPEYVRGELVERPYNDLAHSFLAGRMCRFMPHRGFTTASISLRIAPDLIRIADMAIFAKVPRADIPDEPPLVAVEILVPEDRFTHIMQKLSEYWAWGVANIWVISPKLQKFYVYDGSLRERDRFELAEYNLRISAADLFGG